MKNKKVLSLLLAVMILLSSLPFAGVTAFAETSGDYSYIVLEDGTAEITKYTGTDTVLAVPSKIDGYTVTSIGNSAFSKCSSLTGVTMPDSVTSIGNEAFYYCTSLASINIPNSVMSIGDYAFYHCDSLTSATIGNGVTSIGSKAFGNSGLRSIDIPSSVTSMSNYAFAGCLSLVTVTIENGVTSIGYAAFYDCSSLTNITIPDSVTSIGGDAFYNCTALTNISVPNSVTSIGVAAFYNSGYYNDESNWENDVLYIGNHLIGVKNTISGECSIKSGVLTIPAYAFSNCYNLSSIVIPDGVTSIGDYAFETCYNLESITIPDSVTSIGEGAFRGTAYYNNESNWDNGVLYIGNHLIDANNSVPQLYLVKNGTITIADYAFEGRDILTEIIIPNSVKTIGNYAFNRCSNLTTVTLSNGVRSIGNCAFSYCFRLTSITIPDSVTSIGESAFFYCFTLKNLTIPESVTSIGNGAFYRCSGLSSVTIPDSITRIEDYTFSESSLQYITIHNGVTSIGNNAFSGSRLTSVFIPESVTSIGSSAFKDCTNLTSVEIENGVETVGNNAFEGCSNLTSITIPSSVSSLGDYAFYKCSNLANVTIENGVTAIGEGAFSYCPSLKYIVAPKSVTCIAGFAFYESSGLTDVYILNEECDILDEYSIPETVTIYGYRNSKSQEFAKNYDREFVALDDFDCSSGNHCSVIVDKSISTCTEHIGYKCVLCEETYSEEILNHNYKNGFCAVCREKDPDYFIPSISENETITVTIENGGDLAYFAFIPEKSDTYVFCSTGSFDTYGYLYDDAMNALASNDDGGEGNNFSISHYLEAGKTYYFACKLYNSGATGSFSVTLTHQHTYNSVVTAPTCTEQGYTTYTCSKCDDSYVSNYRNATGHSYDSGKVTKEATYTETGILTYTCQNCGDKITETIEKKVLATPQLSSVSADNSGITIKWGKVSGAEMYRVFYKEKGESSWHKVVDTTSTSCTWTGGKTGTAYTFTVRCVSKDGKTYTSAYDSAGKSITYAATPKISSVTNTTTGVQIKWAKSEGASKYRVFYKANGESGWHKVVDTTSTSYTWTKAVSGTKYTFTVRCIDKDGQNYTSAYDTTGKSINYVAAPKISSVTNTATGVQIKWEKSDGAAKYRVFYKENGESTWHKVVDTTSTSYTWTKVTSGTKYTFTVRCINSAGSSYTSAYDTTGKSITYLSAPKISSLTKNSEGVQISWGKVTGAVDYKVFRKTENGSWTAIGTTTSVCFIDTTVKKGTKYYYTVRCISKDGKTYTSGYDSAGKSITY